MFEIPLEIRMLIDYLDAMDMVEEDKKYQQEMMKKSDEE
jgi:hypothetical protein